MLFLDANVIISASIEGDLFSGVSVKHRAATQSKNLFNKISESVEKGKAVAFVSFTAEKEARTHLASAIEKSINECWPQNGFDEEKRIKIADNLDLFRRACAEQLNDNLSLLARHPLPKKIADVETQVSAMFDDLQKFFEQEQSRMEWGDKPAPHHLRKVTHEVKYYNDKSLGPKTFKQGIEMSDKRILSEAIAMSTPGRGDILVSLDNHYISEWAREAIKKNFKLNCMSPEEVKHIY